MAYSLKEDRQLLGEGVIIEENIQCVEVRWEREGCVFAIGYYTQDGERILLSIADQQILPNQSVNEWF